MDDITVATVDAEIELSLAIWADEIATGAIWPEVADFKTEDAYHKQKDRFDAYLTGPETRQIGRVLFQLQAYGIETVEAMEQMIDRHNASLLSDLDDPDYMRESGINPQRLRQAVFTSESEKEVLLNAVARHGSGVLHKSAYGRLLVRHANVNRINTSLDILRAAGFLTVRKGANNADVIFSDGRLEAAHRASIERIVDAARDGI